MFNHFCAALQRPWKSPRWGLKKLHKAPKYLPPPSPPEFVHFLFSHLKSIGSLSPPHKALCVCWQRGDGDLSVRSSLNPSPRDVWTLLHPSSPLPSPPLSRPIQSLRVYQCETRADKTAYVTAWPSSLGLGREEVKEGEPRWRQRPCQRQADVVWMMSAGKNRAGSADRGTGW